MEGGGAPAVDHGLSLRRHVSVFYRLHLEESCNVVVAHLFFPVFCRTPVGQAIGLATHTLYHPESETGLLLVGTMNAISAGLLVFSSLVELLAEDFLSDDSWRVLRGRRRIVACSLVFLGAVLMSLIGAWA